MQPKNWLIRVYLRNKEIDAWQIENRNDNEAFNEAAAVAHLCVRRVAMVQGNGTFSRWQGSKKIKGRNGQFARLAV